VLSSARGDLTSGAGPLSFGRGGRDHHSQSRHADAVRRWAWSPSRRGLTTRSSPAEELHVIAYRATSFDVPREPAQFVASLLAVERRRRVSRALTCFRQAVLGCGGVSDLVRYMTIQRPNYMKTLRQTSRAAHAGRRARTGARRERLPESRWRPRGGRRGQSHSATGTALGSAA
jgi:hypothetical protein